MTEPTDDELDAVIAEYQTRTYPQDMHPRFERAIMRAAIAKWGTPPAVAGEPFCYVSVNKQGDITRTMKRKDKWTNIPLYTTPQPTQAQAGAVPLTVDEVEQLIAQWSYELHGDRARYLVRMTEQHHGIKGGQHGL